MIVKILSRLTNGFLLVFLLLPGLICAAPTCPSLPFVKQWKPAGGEIRSAAFSIPIASEALAGERTRLASLLEARGIPIRAEGVPIRLALAPLSLPIRPSAYRERLESQGYHLALAADSIRIESPNTVGIFYGIQTLDQLIGDDGAFQPGEALDWPDLPVRMVMVDPARQNETPEYYRRMIAFCARYKINALLIHLTDDQTSCLYHENYPELMHPRAWRAADIRDLVAFARGHHIELVPEIESFGHSRMFLRRADYRDILHRNLKDKSTISWMQPTAPGYANVLCPASPKTYEYLEKMYGRAADTFPSRFLHIGFDEVDMTECDRCNEAFPGIERPAWFLKHLLRCRDLAAARGRTVALWGDMLFAHPAILDGLDARDLIVYDWNYKADVSDESVRFFKEKGFEVMACPSLMCAPHFLYPNEQNHANVRRFAAIAVAHDALGLNTTIWVPVRYLSDVLWPSVALAAVHAWSGSQWDDARFRTLFMQDYFSPVHGEVIGQLWGEMAGVTWTMKDFFTACWVDEEGLGKARALLEERGPEIQEKRAALGRIERDLRRLSPDIRKNPEAWNAMLRSVAILAYALDRLAASGEVRPDGQWDTARLARLEAGCVEALRWIESDWDRNRFPDDPNKEGIHLPTQHLLWRFKEMRQFHQNLVREQETGSRAKETRSDPMESGI